MKLNYKKADPKGLYSPLRTTLSARQIPYEVGQYLAWVGEEEYIITLNPFDALEDFHYIAEGTFNSQAEIEYILKEYE